MFPIPANATRIRYLESTGTQYIDTGVVPTDTTGFAVRAISMPTGTGNNRLIGCQDGQVRCLFSGSPKTTTNSFFGWNAAVGPLGNYPNSELVASLNFLNDRTAVLNDETKASALETLGALTSTICIFGHNVNGAILSSQLFSGRLIYAKVSNGSTLVRDFVPVRVGYVGYLFDRVTGQLYGNAGTGVFVLGPDTFQQGVVPTRMMPMGVRNNANPYQTDDDALYACVDGEWNSAFGVHDPAISVPVDIMGHIVFSKSGSGTITFDPSCISFDGNVSASGLSDVIASAVNASSATIMAGFHQDTFQNYNGMFQCAGKRGLGYYSQNSPSNRTMGGISWRGKSSPDVGSTFYNTNGSHYCFVGSGTSMSVWINGTKSGTFTPSAASDQITGGLGLGLGYDKTAKGRLYYIRFYKRALTDSEVSRFTSIDMSRFGSTLA